jgi:hypothetical protein
MGKRKTALGYAVRSGTIGGLGLPSSIPSICNHLRDVKLGFDACEWWSSSIRGQESGR